MIEGFREPRVIDLQLANEESSGSEAVEFSQFSEFSDVQPLSSNLSSSLHEENEAADASSVDVSEVEVDEEGTTTLICTSV